jgi:hypothetical protein
MIPLLVALIRSASSAPPPPEALVPPEVVAAATRTTGQPIADRMAAVSAALLGRPYVHDPLGEGVPPDADPYFRYDVFDCLTFVEEVLSFSIAPEPSGAAVVRDALRYGDAPRDYRHRRHFMELQWIPGVVGDGWLRDTTSTYGRTVALDKEVTAATWAGWASRKRFALADADLPVGPMHLDVLPLEEARKVQGSIRPGSLILTVHTDRPAVPAWVFHVSLLVPGPSGAPVLRHATKIGDGGTRDHGFAWYLDHIGTYEKWEVLGIAVLEPIER